MTPEEQYDDLMQEARLVLDRFAVSVDEFADAMAALVAAARRAGVGS